MTNPPKTTTHNAGQTSSATKTANKKSGKKISKTAAKKSRKTAAKKISKTAVKQRASAVSATTTRPAYSKQGKKKAGKKVPNGSKKAGKGSRLKPSQATKETVTKANRKPATGTWPPAADRLQGLLDGLGDLFPRADCALDHDSPFQLLIATILSAQCTDERVNKVTPQLFEHFPTPAAMAEAPVEVLEELVRSTGFYRQKAKNIRATAQILTDTHEGELPRSVDALRALPGVARKTANVVLGTAFGIAAGVVVDTHVQRLALRLGLTRYTAPEKIEKELMTLIPKKRWIILSHQLILHGRQTCTARKPNCEACTLAPFCPSAFSES